MTSNDNTNGGAPELTELHHLPEGLLDLDSDALSRLLRGPTLIHLRGQREPALFVSALMHGNEPVGWDAVRQVLREHINAQGELQLPRSLSLFIGNVEAAALHARHLPHQPDYNRVWDGSDLAPTPEHALMREVVDIMARRGIFASVDLHNNTGANPHYACVNVIDNRFLHLATLFSRTVVYFIRPRGVQSQAMAKLCPAVTLECGKVSDRLGIEHARDYVNACLHLARIPEHPVPAHDIDLFHTVAQVRIPAELDFTFSPGQASLVLSPEIERLNFRELAAGTALGACGNGRDVSLEVRDEWGRDVSRHYFHVDDGELKLRVPVMPSMLSRDETVIRQDCLCYLMERYSEHVPKRG
ncbi:MAG: succinylglutamate desuccinylase/aspartoacylase family protein [Thiohalocapsa sp.]|jgi:succinylglutamate desuccinylase|nr:succinylglutamate desuccinylase/aspartoacylase family protein [Thiohalocapsa sp.]MCF7991989.1 succinylglutamate desuccinylase/aspartoacylase family protein [Thiohalocapsa sp.]